MKCKFFISSLVLLLFALLGGGSFTEGELVAILIGIPVAAVVCGIASFISSKVNSNHKKKRLQIFLEDEQSSSDFDRSVFIGNDRCRLYFDASKKQIMVVSVTTKGIKKEYIDNFEFPGKSLTTCADHTFSVYNPGSRQFLIGTYDDLNIVYEIISMAEKDTNKDTPIHNAIPPTLKTHKTSLILTDECHGLIAISESGKIKNIFNYINADKISLKQGDQPTITTNRAGDYLFIMDDFFKVLVIIGHGYKVFNYADIIDISYEENGTLLYTKSTARTVGGAIIGGALMGGAGAVVGGLSGASHQNKEVSTMDIKILLRNTTNTSYILHFNDAKTILKTKNASDIKLYNKYLDNANKAKDILSIIIDKAKQSNDSNIQQHATPTTNSIADELAKLAKLKADGILTEEEFLAQKSKLLKL